MPQSNPPAGRRELGPDPRYDPDELQRFVTASVAYGMALVCGEDPGPKPVVPKPDPSRLSDPHVRERVEQRQRDLQHQIDSLHRNVAAAPRTASGAIILGKPRRVAPQRTVAHTPRPQAPRPRAARRARPPASGGDPPGQREPGEARRTADPEPPVARSERPHSPAPVPYPPAAQAPAEALPAEQSKELPAGVLVGSLREFNWATRDLPPDERGELFDSLSEDVQAALWDQLQAQCDACHERDRRGEPTHTLVDIPGYGDAPDSPAARPAERSAHRPPRGATGRRVRVVRCPYPDHPDRDPSFAIYGDGGYCFGCHRRASTAEMARLGVVA